MDRPVSGAGNDEAVEPRLQQGVERGCGDARMAYEHGDLRPGGGVRKVLAAERDAFRPVADPIQLALDHRSDQASAARPEGIEMIAMRLANVVRRVDLPQ